MKQAGKQGEGTAPAAVPRPGSCEETAAKALAAFAFEERLVGAAKAHESFDGVMAEHALALEEVRDELREAFHARDAEVRPRVERAHNHLNEQITYVKALGSVAANETEEP